MMHVGFPIPFPARVTHTARPLWEQRVRFTVNGRAPFASIRVSVFQIQFRRIYRGVYGTSAGNWRVSSYNPRRKVGEGRGVFATMQAAHQMVQKAFRTHRGKLEYRIVIL